MAAGLLEEGEELLLLGLDEAFALDDCYLPAVRAAGTPPIGAR